VATADVSEGKLPLKVRFDGSGSSDKDGDTLTYEWKFGLGGSLGSAKEAAPGFEFAVPGVHPVTLTVTDAHGASNTTSLEVRAGNAPPQLTFAEPANGSFYDPGQRIAYRLMASDEEDGAISGERVASTTKTTDRLAKDESALPPGLALMRGTTCFACHLTDAKSIGPGYLDVANRYRGDEAARELLAQKIIAGGVGVWGKEIPMPPHPQQHAGADPADGGLGALARRRILRGKDGPDRRTHRAHGARERLAQPNAAHTTTHREHH